MYSLRNKSMFFVFVAMMLVVASCTPATPVVPTADPAVIQQTVQAAQTQAVETAMAQLTANAPLPTETPLPTNTVPPTEIPPTATVPPVILPTNTVAIVYPTWTAAPALPTVTSTPSAYNCRIVKLSPASGTVLEPGVDFDLNVTLRNTGTEEWGKNDFDFRRISGPKFSSSPEILDLPSQIDPDEEVKFVVDMIAPDDEGSYTATWGLSGIASACSVTISIRVDE